MIATTSHKKGLTKIIIKQALILLVFLHAGFVY